MSAGSSLVALAARATIAEIADEALAWETDMVRRTRNMVSTLAGGNPPIEVVELDAMPSPYDHEWLEWLSRQHPELQEALDDPFERDAPRSRNELRGELAKLTFDGSFAYKVASLLIAYLEAGDIIVMTKGSKARRLTVDVIGPRDRPGVWLADDKRGVLDATDLAAKVLRGWTLAVES